MGRSNQSGTVLFGTRTTKSLSHIAALTLHANKSLIYSIINFKLLDYNI